MKLDILTWICIITITIILYRIIVYVIRKIRLGTLTGNYVHYKTHRGTVIEVEHLTKNGVKLFSEATDKEIKILKYYNYLN